MHVSKKIFHNRRIIIKIVNPIICWMGACCTAGFDEGPVAASCSTFGDEAAAAAAAAPSSSSHTGATL